MQNKGAITFLAILFALVCLYELSFTFATRRVEKNAKEVAQGDENREKQYLDSIKNQGVFNFLWLKNFTYNECKKKEINLGLDLKGGMNVTMEVDVADILIALSNNSQEEIFLNSIARAKEGQKSSETEFVDLFVNEFEDIDPKAKLSSTNIFGTYLKNKIDFGADNQEVKSVLKEEVKTAIDNTYNVLRTRIDKFGVAQPIIQKADVTGRIIIELPGVKEPERVRNLLQGAANLEFWEVYRNGEIFGDLSAANDKLKDFEEILTDSIDVVETAETTKEKAAVEKKSQDETESDTAEIDLLSQLDDAEIADDSLQLSAQEWRKTNPLFAELIPNTDREGQLVSESPVVGFALETNMEKINKYLAIPEIRNIFSSDVKFLWDGQSNENYRALYAVKNPDGTAPLDGSVMVDARQDYDESGMPNVSMTMNNEGAKNWARLTRENVGNFIAVALDDYVYSVPRVNQEINSITSQITGNFTIEEAQDLATKLKSGKLPVPAKIVSEEVVGPSLGKKAIRAGMWSFLIAFALVLFYMLFFYSRGAGLVANLALIANLFFVFGVLASLPGAVLTLPGIAGIVLTIGMSVDANVLIYERVKEELLAGKRVPRAIKDGYWNAYSAILDGNITTLLTGIILFIFGEGPIKGFATTLLIGICTSLFSAIFITRLIFEWMLGRKKKITFSTSVTENWLRNINFPFLSKRKIFYFLSGTLIFVSLASLVVRGLDQSIDFTGGRTYIVEFDQDVNTEEIAQSLQTFFQSLPEVKTFGGANQVKISTKYKIDEENPEIDNEVEDLLFIGLSDYLPEDTTKENFLENNRKMSQKVGPTIADDIKRAAVLAIIFALIVIFLYIMIRFKNWQFGLGALAALAHDTIIVLGIFSIFYGLLPFSLEIDQAFIAAILTVVGYSINDTVVVFDRIREYLKIYPKRERDEVVNKAMNSTLRRTFSTSLSTFVVLLAIFLFGGVTIKGFIFGLIIGVIVGTYSSLFIATPIAYDTAIKFQQILSKRKKR